MAYAEHSFWKQGEQQQLEEGQKALELLQRLPHMLPFTSRDFSFQAVMFPRRLLLPCVLYGDPKMLRYAATAQARNRQHISMAKAAELAGVQNISKWLQMLYASKVRKAWAG